MIRMCCHLNHSCDRNDVAAQPCIAALITDYLEALQWNVLAKGAEGGPGDPMEIAQSRQMAAACRAEAHRAVTVTCRGFNTMNELHAWLQRNGVGYCDWKDLYPNRRYPW
jgi:hypothetical protein